MKQLLLTAYVCLFIQSHCVAQESDDLYPDTLLSWLKIIESPEFDLIYASTNEKSFSAISVDKDGDLLVASHERKRDNSDDRDQNSDSRWSWHIVDLETGKDLWDATSKKVSPDSARVTYRGTTGLSEWSITNAYPRGIIYPLKSPTGQNVRYEVFRYIHGKKEVRESHTITIPKRRDR